MYGIVSRLVARRTPLTGASRHAHVYARHEPNLIEAVNERDPAAKVALDIRSVLNRNIPRMQMAKFHIACASLTEYWSAGDECSTLGGYSLYSILPVLRASGWLAMVSRSRLSTSPRWM